MTACMGDDISVLAFEIINMHKKQAMVCVR